MSDSYRIFETDEFLRGMKKLSAGDAKLIETKLKEYVYPQLKAEPYYGNNIKKLRTYSPSVWRYRIGKFRLFYSVDQDEAIVYILTVHFRKDAYK